MRLLKFSLAFFLSLVSFSQNRYLDSLARLYDAATADTQKINLLANIGSRLISQGQTKKAIEYYDQILFKFNKTYPEKCIDAKNKIVFCFISTEEYGKADSLILTIIDECKKINYDKGLGYAYRNSGLIFAYKSDYKNAVNNQLKALNIFEKEDNKQGIMTCYSDLGMFFYWQEDYTRAIYYWENTMKYSASKETEDYITNCANLGHAYLEIENFYKAEQSFKAAKDFCSRKKNWSGYANALSGLGNLELKRKNYPAALNYYKEIIKIREEHSSRNSDLAIVYLNISLIYGNLKKPKEALEFGLKGYEKAKESDDINELSHAYDNLNTAYANSGNYEKAYEFSQLYNNLKDSITNIENQKQINELDKQYQTEKKEKENQLLSKQLEIQQIQGKQQKLYLIISAVILVLIAFLTVVLFRQNKHKQRTNLKLAVKNKIIEEQHKDITDSIKYAQRIQQAILPPKKFWHELLPNSFVLYKPKDILSGDFYWIEQNAAYIYVAAADCTGHGVPGALMSIVNYNLLNKAVLEKNIVQPSRILDEVNKFLTVSLHQTYNESEVRDGMDIAICALHKKSNQMQFAGAFNGGYIFKKDGTMIDINGDKKPVGAFIEEKISLFTNNTLMLDEGDKVFIFSDGYADQFGGTKGKKLKYIKLKQFISESLQMNMEQQKNYLEEKFNEWKGNYEQVDDVLIIGFTV